MFHILNPKYNELSEQNFKETIDEIWDFVDTNNSHILSNPQNKIKGNRPLITIYRYDGNGVDTTTRGDQFLKLSIFNDQKYGE